MTAEKVRQMQNYREKAIQIQNRIIDRKQHNDIKSVDIKSESSQTRHCKTGGDFPQRSQEQHDDKLKESEESMNFLQDMITRQQGGGFEDSMANQGSTTITSYTSAENLAKIKKLQKSEILIYDNSKNEIIQVLSGHQESSVRIERKDNLPPKKPTHLLLAGVDGKGLSSIPSICLNPPTPLTVNKNISDSLESLIISESPIKSSDLAEEYSSAESANSMRTHSDKMSTRNIRQNIAKATQNKSSASSDQKSITPRKNVTAKIQQFEAISNDCSTPHSSPEMSCRARNTCMDTLSSGTMNRSATSPSIKLSASNRSSSSRSQSFAQDSDNSPENSLVRSSSFTLEGPSKVLIDHMRQQKTICANKPTEKPPINIARITIRKPISSSPLRAHRDTVESKAKKVQKVELKSSKQKLQQKTSQSKLAQAAVASISPYNALALNHNSNNLYKTKKSPYDLSKTSHTSLQNPHKTPSVQMRKSNSASSNLSQSKTSKSKGLSNSSSTTNHCKSPMSTGKESLPLMDKIQKEKFQRLLAQQEEEQRRLQHSFEMQQKLLLEQLNRDMSADQLKSQNNSSCNSSPRYKKLDHLQEKLNLTVMSVTTKPEKVTTSPIDFKQHKLHQQQPSPSVSNTKNLSQTTNIHHSSYPIHFAQSPHTVTLTSSHLSSMDYSNANTSLDISTLSTQTSPETGCTTPHAKQNLKNNDSGNKTVSSMLSTRRRLFPTEVNFVETPEIPLSSRSTASSSYSLGQRTVEQVQPLNQNNKNSSLVTTNASSRRVSFKLF